MKVRFFKILILICFSSLEAQIIDSVKTKNEIGVEFFGNSYSWCSLTYSRNFIEKEKFCFQGKTGIGFSGTVYGNLETLPVFVSANVYYGKKISFMAGVAINYTEMLDLKNHPNYYEKEPNAGYHRFFGALNFGLSKSWKKIRLFGFYSANYLFYDDVNHQHFVNWFGLGLNYKINLKNK